MYCSQWEKTSFSAVAAPAIDLNAQTIDCSIWLAFIRLVTKPRLSEQSAVCTRTQTCILSNRRNTFFDHHFRLAPLCGHDEYHQTISSRSGLYYINQPAKESHSHYEFFYAVARYVYCTIFAVHKLFTAMGELTMHNNRLIIMNINIKAPVDSTLNLVTSRREELCPLEHDMARWLRHLSALVIVVLAMTQGIFYLLCNDPLCVSSSSLQVQTATANRTLFFLGLIYKNSKLILSIILLLVSNALLTRIPSWFLAQDPAQHLSLTRPLV